MAIPRLFMIFVLLQIVSKILERVIASGLTIVVRLLQLVSRNQYGLFCALRSFDAALSRVATVRTLQCPGLRVSTHLLHIKGGFKK